MVDVYVYGDSLPAFAAALECAEVGLTTRLLLPADGPDWPAVPVRDPDGAIATLLQRVAAPLTSGGAALSDALPMRVEPSRVLMPGTRGAWSVVPEPSVLGIPAVPLSTESLAFLRTGAAIRAYLDRVKPLLTVGKTHDFGKLVRDRFGEGLYEQLVAPLVQERFGTRDVEVAVAAPGLNETFSRAGSLSAAVLAYSERNRAQETGVIPSGGWAAGRELFIERLGHYGVECVIVEGPHTVLSLFEAFADAEDPSGAIVVDAGANLPGETAEVLQSLMPQRVRVHAHVSVRAIDAPGDAASAQIAIERDGAEALRVVRLPNDAPWAVRMRRTAEGACEAEIAGPAVADIDENDAAAQLTSALAAAGLEAVSDPVIRVCAAPHTTVAERVNARSLLESERQASGELLPIGSELHGGDTAAAVADAVTATILLRRRLLGISD